MWHAFLLLEHHMVLDLNASIVKEWFLCSCMVALAPDVLYPLKQLRDIECQNQQHPVESK